MKKVVLISLLGFACIFAKAQKQAERIKQRREVLLKSGISSLKSDAEKLAHFIDLVAIDVAYYKISPDSVVKKEMGGHYNSLAWYSILTQNLSEVDYDLKQSIKYDPKSRYPYSNMPLLLLLQGHYRKAKALYLKLKDQPFDSTGSTFKDEFLEDFRELAAKGITNKAIQNTIQLLNSTPKK